MNVILEKSQENKNSHACGSPGTTKPLTSVRTVEKPPMENDVVRNLVSDVVPFCILNFPFKKCDPDFLVSFWKAVWPKMRPNPMEIPSFS